MQGNTPSTSPTGTATPLPCLPGAASTFLSVCHDCVHDYLAPHLTTVAPWPECRLPSALASCSNSSFSLVRGDSVTWRCQLTAPSSASLHLRLNHTTMLLASQPRPSCGKDPQVTFHIQETPLHICYSNFTVVVVICSANESVVGDFRIMRSSGEVANGTLVVVKLAPQPTVEGKSGEACRASSAGGSADCCVAVCPQAQS